MRPWYIPQLWFWAHPCPILPHALYLKAHVEKYANIDEWGDFLLNDPAHAGTSRKLTHNKFALSKTANECGMATTCKESQLPYHYQGQPDQSRKRADMTTFSGGCVRENQHLHFNKNTCLIMDVTIGHVFDMLHIFKRRNIQTMETKNDANTQNITNNNVWLLLQWLQIRWALSQGPSLHCAVHKSMD